MILKHTFHKRYGFLGFLTGMTALLLVFGHMVYSQTARPELLTAHINKPFYATGETIYFKVYVLNPSASRSNILHVDLVDTQGKVKIDQVLQIHNNSASGMFNLPYNFEEGNYIFRAFTAWNLNFNGDYNYQQVIPIYNEWDESISSVISGETTTDTDTLHQGEHPTETRIEIRLLNETPVRTGDSIHVKYLPVSSGSVIRGASISVLDHNLITTIPMNENLSMWDPSRFNNLPDTGQHVPEATMQFKGIISDPADGLPLHSNVLSLFEIGHGKFTRLQSENGHIRFELPLFKGSQPVQLINMNPFQSSMPNVQLEKINVSVPFIQQVNQEALRTPEVLNYLYHSKLRRKINEIFTESMRDSIALSETRNLPFEPDKSYQMSKSKLIRNLEEFIVEAITNASKVRKNGNTEIRLFNSDTKKYFMKSPWYIVDGYFIFDDSIARNIPFSALKQVDLYTSTQSIFKYFEPIMIQGGIIAVYTHNNYLVNHVASLPNTLIIDGIAENAAFKDLYNPSIPDLSPAIYWNPEPSAGTFSFRANDVSGKYLIMIKGADQAGKELYGNLEIKVLPR